MFPSVRWKMAMNASRAGVARGKALILKSRRREQQLFLAHVRWNRIHRRGLPFAPPSCPLNPEP